MTGADAVRRRSAARGQGVRAMVWTDLPPRGTDPAVDAAYPDGLVTVLADALRPIASTVALASVDDAECGLGDDALADADVLVWWGHRRHDDVPDAVAARVQAAVLRGLGLVALHSAAMSKPFMRLMGTTCTFPWREPGDRELMWVVDPTHPIAHGLPPAIDLPAHEMYGEPFDIPAPEELVLISSFSRRRGVPQRLLLPTRRRPDLLPQRRPRDQRRL